MTREEVVQAALTVERWCKEHVDSRWDCDCPFTDAKDNYPCAVIRSTPFQWGLEKFLRTRGLKDGEV